MSRRVKHVHAKPGEYVRVHRECYLLNRGFAVVLPQKQLALI